MKRFFSWVAKLFKKKSPPIIPNLGIPDIEENPGETPLAVKQKVFLEFRDGVGISGACKNAKKHDPKYIIEGHFNSYNKSASGYLVIAHESSRAFAEKFLQLMKKIYPSRRNRKVDTTPSRGGNNIKYCSGSGIQNILIEPFFGDTPSDCISVKKMTEIMIEFISSLDGPVVLIVGHDSRASGAFSQHLKMSEYDYWSCVFKAVQAAFDQLN